MQPIKTTNAMNPAPAKGIESFPTPVIDDVVISEVVNAWKGNYEKLEYGTLWKDVSHAPNQGSFPEHKLVYQQPTSEDGQWVKRIWVNDRVNQDSYNYAIKYSAGSQEHPIYIRTYLVPRETYAPLLDGTPDPLFPAALLVDEEATRTEGELDSKYITVTRVYETIPGPRVPTKRYNERGDLETVIVQTVPPFSPPDPDGLLVTGSQVVQEEMGKGVKTTSTVTDHALLQIKEKKEGLLGETVTTDDIVDPTSNPDDLSLNIVASSVEQYTATKARKRTTTASGPVFLKGRQIKDGLLGDAFISQSIVPAGSNADPLSVNVISSEVTPIDGAKSKKTTITSFGPNTLSGNQNKEGLLGKTTIKESIVPAGSPADSLSENVISSEVTPIDIAKSKKTTIESSGPTSLEANSLVNSPVGLVNATITKSIEKNTFIPSYNKQDGFNLIGDEVSAIDSVKSKREKVSVKSWPTTRGRNFDEEINIGIPYTQNITPIDSVVSGNFIQGTEIKPIDQWKSISTTPDLNAFNNALQSYYVCLPTLTNIKLPDILEGITVYWGTSYAAGADWSFSPSITTGSYSLSVSGGSKSSSSLNGDVNFRVRNGFSGAAKSNKHIFFMPVGSGENITTESLMARLKSLSKNIKFAWWPYIQMMSENIVLITGSKSLSKNNSKSQWASINGSGSAEGKGESYDVNVNANSINIPQTLHGEINIKEEFIGGALPGNLSVTYGVRPKNLPKTSVFIGGEFVSANKFPIGEYLYDANCELYKYGWAKITAVTVNITSEYV